MSIDIENSDICEECGGTGEVWNVDGTEVDVCSKCSGLGVVNNRTKQTHEEQPNNIRPE